MPVLAAEPKRGEGARTRRRGAVGNPEGGMSRFSFKHLARHTPTVTLFVKAPEDPHSHRNQHGESRRRSCVELNASEQVPPKELALVRKHRPRCVQNVGRVRTHVPRTVRARRVAINVGCARRPRWRQPSDGQSGMIVVPMARGGSCALSQHVPVEAVQSHRRAGHAPRAVRA